MSERRGGKMEGKKLFSETFPIILSIVAVVILFVLFALSWLVGMSGLPLVLLLTVGPILTLIIIMCFIWDRIGK